MAEDIILVKYVQRLDELERAHKEIEKLLKRNDDAVKKSGATQQGFYNKNARSVNELRENLAFLEKARDKAFNPASAGKLNDRIKEIKSNIDKLANATNRVDLPAKLSLADRATNALNSSMGKLAGAVVGAFAVERIMAFGAEAAKAALQAQGIEKAFDKLNRPDLLDKLRAATKGTVDDVTLMRNAVQANNFKIPLDALANMFAFAEQRARDTGESVDYLVESAVLGVSRQSLMIIDNLGISGEAVRKEMEKTGDFATAVSNIMAQEMAKQGKAIDDASTKVDRYAAQWQNFKVGFGQMLVDTGVWLAEGLETFDKGLKNFFNLLSGGDGYGNGGKLFRNEVKKTVEETVTASTKADTAKKQAAKATLESLKAELEFHQKSLETQELGSAKFKSTLLEIERIQNRIDTATGKNAEKLAKDAEKARKEKERLARIAAGPMGKIDMGLSSVDNSENKLEAEKRLNDQVFEESKRLGDSLREFWDKERDEKLKKDEEAARKQMEKQMFYLDQIQTFGDLAFSYAAQLRENEQNEFNELSEKRLKSLEERHEKGLISEKEYALQKAAIEKEQAIKEAELARKAAEAEKAQALFSIAVATAKAVAEANASIAANADPTQITRTLMIGFALGQGLAQAALVMSKPLPEIPAFAKGVIGFQGKGTETSDENLVRISRGESIITAKKTSQFHDELNEMMYGNWEKYKETELIMPAIEAYKRKMENESAGKVFSNSTSAFDDTMLIHAIQKNRVIELGPKTIKQLKQNSGNYKRRTPNG